MIAHPWTDAVSYAFTVIDVPQDIDCYASLGSDDGYALWVNGAEIGRQAISRGAKPDQNRHKVHLKKGKNTILFKVEDTGAGGGFMLHFVDKTGNPVKFKVTDD